MRPEELRYLRRLAECLREQRRMLLPMREIAALARTTRGVGAALAAAEVNREADMTVDAALQTARTALAVAAESAEQRRASTVRKAVEARRKAARASEARRRRQWLLLHVEVRRDRRFASRGPRAWAAETDRRLADWLTKRGEPVAASTIRNQRIKGRWTG